MEQTQELSPHAEKILHRITHPKAVSIIINRVPIDVKERFVALANDEFVGDFGFCLKWLMDGIPNQHIEVLRNEVQAYLEEHAQRMNVLEARIQEVKLNSVPEQKENIRHMIDGTERKVKQ